MARIDSFVVGIDRPQPEHLLLFFINISGYFSENLSTPSCGQISFIIYHSVYPRPSEIWGQPLNLLNGKITEGPACPWPHRCGRRNCKKDSSIIALIALDLRENSKSSPSSALLFLRYLSPEG